MFKLKLSTKGRYGLRAVFEVGLKYGEEPVSIKTISENQGISESYLEQLFKNLRKEGIVKSIRGAQGGYELTKHPSLVKVSDVINALEGSSKISECIDDGFCSRENYCPTRIIWLKVQKSIDDVMDTTTIQDIIDDYMKNNIGGK